MKETDEHFSAAQIAALDALGLDFKRVPRRRVRLLTVGGLSIRSDPRLATHAQREPLCPVIRQGDDGDTVLLPNGQALAVPHQ